MICLKWYNKFIGPALDRMHDRSMIFPSFEVLHPPVTLLTAAPPTSSNRKHIIMLGRLALYAWRHCMTAWRHRMTVWRLRMMAWRLRMTAWRHRMTAWRHRMTAWRLRMTACDMWADMDIGGPY